MDWKIIEQRIVEDDQGKWDSKITGASLRISEDGRLRIPSDGPTINPYRLSELATTQMCQRLGIPVEYYKRLSTEMQAVVGNYDLARLNGKVYLLRGKGDWVRAFLSTDYVTYNNGHIVETVQHLIRHAEVTVKNFVLEETNMFLKMVSEDIKDLGSGLKAGIMIGNSEVGMGSVSVEPFIFRLPCTNDLIVSPEKTFRHAHISFTPSEFSRRVAEGISCGFSIANELLDEFVRAHQDAVADPIDTIRHIAEQRKLSKRFADQVVSSYLTEPIESRFGVINAFTRAAQQLGPLQRIEIERFAGTLLVAQL